MKSRCCRFRPATIRYFEQLLRRLHEVFVPLGVSISLPSLRVNEQLKSVAELMSGDRRSMTLAPEVARDDMREQIRKKIKNQDLYDGCREAFRRGWKQVKLYFLCGLPGERTSTWMASSTWPRRSPRSAAKRSAAMPRSRPACRTSCPSPTRRISGTPCRRASIFTTPIGTCGGAGRSNR